MENSSLLYIVVLIITVKYLIDLLLDFLNAKTYNSPLPNELKDIYESDEYEKLQAYLRVNYNFSLLNDSFSCN